MKHYTISLKLLGTTVLLSGFMLHAEAPTFHLKNKGADAIQIDIKQNNKSLTSLQPVAKNGTFEWNLDTSKPTLLEVHVCPNIGQCYMNDHDTFLVKINAGKTVYLKFDGKKVVPQKGNKKMDKTTYGYSTANNVTNKDISVLKGTTKKRNSDIGRIFQQRKSN